MTIIMMTKITIFILMFSITSPSFTYSLDDAVQDLQLQGKVISAKHRQVNGRHFYFIRVLTQDGRLKRYKINAITGKKIH